LAIHSNTSYLSKPKSCSPAGGHMFMVGKDNIPFNIGAVLNILQIIQAAMSSVAEAELGTLFINVKTAVSMHQMLAKLGHPQPHTPIQINNATTHALLTNKILPKALKAMDMHFHWLRCRNAQGHFCYYWRPGTRLLHQASPNQPPQIRPPHNTNTCQQSQIHKTLHNYNTTNNV
jgi:hypothetical protein